MKKFFNRNKKKVKPKKGGSVSAPPDDCPDFSADMKSSSSSTAKTVKLYDDFFRKNVTPFVKTSSSLGGSYSLIGKKTDQSFKTLRKLLVKASTMKKPSSSNAVSKCYEPINKCVKYWDGESFKRKGKEEENHWQTMKEAIKCLQWVGVRDTPVKWIKETLDQSSYYSNKVLQNFRQKNKKHVDWVTQLGNLVNGLRDYVKNNHMTGMRWNSQMKGGTVSSGSSGDKGAVFDDITKKAWKGKLKHVETKEKSKLRNSPRTKAVKKPVKKKKPGKTKFKGKGKCELKDGKKWEIENMVNNKNISIDETEKSQTVYIFKCKGSTIQIKGKINSLCVDSCENTSVVFDDVVAAVEVVNCQNCQIQTKGIVRTISIDKTDGLQIFLSKKSFKADLVVCKCSGLNLCPIDNDDYDEIPLPEQFKMKYNHNTKKITVNASSKVGY